MFTRVVILKTKEKQQILFKDLNENLELWCIGGRNTKCCSHFSKSFVGFSKK